LVRYLHRMRSDYPSRERTAEKNFQELFLWTVNSDDMFAGVLVWQKRTRTIEMTMKLNDRECKILLASVTDRQRIELDCTQSRYDQETRNYAASSLVDALLASCDTHEERIELSVNLLGYDPR